MTFDYNSALKMIISRFILIMYFYKLLLETLLPDSSVKNDKSVTTNSYKVILNTYTYLSIKSKLTMLTIVRKNTYQVHKVNIISQNLS